MCMRLSPILSDFDNQALNRQTKRDLVQIADECLDRSGDAGGYPAGGRNTMDWRDPVIKAV
jgi:hypothetical protein